METFSCKSPSEAHIKPWATAQETKLLFPASTGTAQVNTPTQTGKHTRNQKPKHLKMNKKPPKNHDLITRQPAPRAKEEIVVKPELSPWDTDGGREECFQRLPVAGKEPGSQRQRQRTLVPSQHRLQRASHLPTQRNPNLNCRLPQVWPCCSRVYKGTNLCREH